MIETLTRGRVTGALAVLAASCPPKRRSGSRFDDLRDGAPAFLEAPPAAKATAG